VAAPQAAGGAGTRDVESGLQRAGSLLLCAFLFVTYGRVSDFYLQSLHLPLAISIVCLAAVVLTGGLRRVLASPVSIWLVCFTCWLMLSTPFSFWKGGSFETLKIWLKSFLAFVMTVGLVRNVRHCRLATYGIGFAGAAVLLGCVFFRGSNPDGRLGLTQGVLANPNALGQVLLVILPFWVYSTISGAPGWSARRLVSLPAALVMMMLILMTGSRSALLGLVGVALVMLLLARRASKIKVVVPLALAGVFLAAFLPSSLRDRYRTMVRTEDEDLRYSQRSAVGSTEERLELLKESLRMTLDHPLLGVGPGVFEAASAAEAEKRPGQPMWRVTHNSYTEVSSEAGIPALVFYLGALFWSLKTCYSLQGRPEKGEIARIAYWLLLSLVGFVVTAFFANLAYAYYLPTLAGLSAALYRCAKDEAGDGAARPGRARRPRRAVARPSPAARQAAWA
jgi:O-antigen ligase